VTLYGCCILVLSVALAAIVVTPAAAVFNAAPAAPPFAFPATRNQVRVANYTELRAAVRALESDTTIVLAAGTYAIDVEPLIFGATTPVSNIVVRGETGRRDDVILLGKGMDSDQTPVAFLFRAAANVLIADLTVGEVAQHAIEINGSTGSTAIHVYDCRFFDTGEQFIKGNADVGGVDQGPDDGIVEYSVFEYLPRRVVVGGVTYENVYGPLTGYTNGVDIHDGKRWIVRRNLFKNIRSLPGSPQSGGNSVPAVLFWDGSADTIVEQNTFINCERAIALGLSAPGARAIPQPFDHRAGVIRNNFVYRESGITGDVGIAVFNSPSTVVVHNTVYQNVGLSNTRSYPNSIEYRFATTVDALIANNLTDGAIVSRADAQATVRGNNTRATSTFFADVSTGDLHLSRPGGNAAIDAAAAFADVIDPDDWDGDPRPYGPAADVGADEWEPPVASPIRPSRVK
jgi:hypothetical protein